MDAVTYLRIQECTGNVRVQSSIRENESSTDKRNYAGQTGTNGRLFIGKDDRVSPQGPGREGPTVQLLVR